LAPIDLRHPKADLKPLIETARRLGAEFIVIDTLSRALAGGEENSSVDMGALVNHLDEIRKGTRAHVMVIHHTGKNLARGARGHSLLRAATDTEIEVAEGRISVTKQRDLDKDYQAAFELETIELKRDAEGDPVTSCTVRLVARNAAPIGQATAAEQNVLDGKIIEASSTETKGTPIGEIARFLQEDRPDLKQDTVRAHLKNMAKKNIVIPFGRGKWVVNRASSDPSIFFEREATNSAPEKCFPKYGNESGNGVFE
jgi:hypothetical protein